MVVDRMVSESSETILCSTPVLFTNFNEEPIARVKTDGLNELSLIKIYWEGRLPSLALLTTVGLLQEISIIPNKIEYAENIFAKPFIPIKLVCKITKNQQRRYAWGISYNT